MVVLEVDSDRGSQCVDGPYVSERLSVNPQCDGRLRERMKGDDSLKVQLSPRVMQRVQPPGWGVQRSLRLRHSSQEDRVGSVVNRELVMTEEMERDTAKPRENI